MFSWPIEIIVLHLRGTDLILNYQSGNVQFIQNLICRSTGQFILNGIMSLLDNTKSVNIKTYFLIL